MTTGLPTLLKDDGALIWVYKPAGMLVHRQHRGDAGPFLLQWLRDAVGRHVFPVHRLDKPTSGLMLFAGSAESAGGLAEYFRDRKVEKRYEAVVRGHLSGAGSIDYALAPVRDGYGSPSTERREAVTDWTALARAEVDEPVGRYASARYTLLELRPRTGRRHQLRRHLKHVFHPILGDRKYGDRDHNRFARELGFERLALCSTGIRIEPLGVHFQVEPDRDMAGLLARLGLRSTG